MIPQVSVGHSPGTGKGLLSAGVFRFISTPALVALLAASIIALWVRLVIASLAPSLLLQKTLPDDAFYYFTLARNFVQGLGMTMDGQNPTDGFHPLWMALLVPIFWLFGGNESLPIHVALFLGSLFNVITGLLLYSSIKAATGMDRASLIATVAYIFNPGAIMVATNGLETSLALMMFAATLRLCFAYLSKDSFTFRSAVVLGAAAGLTFLSRTDYVFMFITIAIYIALDKNIRLKAGAAYGAAALLVITPWMLWEFVAFHSFLQVSGRALPFVLHHEYIFTDPAPWEIILHSLSRVETAALTVVPNLFFLYQVQHDGLRVGAISTVCLFLITASVLWLNPGLRHKVLSMLSPRASLILIPTLAVAAMFVAHAGVRWSLQGWYFAPVLYLGSLYIGMLYGLGETYLREKRLISLQMPALALTLFLLVLASGTRSAEVWRAGYYPWQIEMYQEALWFRTHASTDWRVGAFNSGIISYFGQVKVVNLDGVVNNAAFRALSNRMLAQYIKDQGITHLADYQFTLEQYSRYFGDEPALGLLPIQEMDDPELFWQNSSIVINQVHAE